MGQRIYKNKTNTNSLLRFVENRYASIVCRSHLLVVHFALVFFFVCITGTIGALPPFADPLPDLGPFSCYTVIPAPDINVVTGEATDCGGPVTVTFISDSPDPGCTGTVIRTYRLADTCGITTDIQQNIFINDNIAPTASPLPSLGTFSCYGNIPAPDVSVVTGESDNCGGLVTVTHAGDSPNPGCSGMVTRSYHLMDVCGNTALITQAITIADNIPPVITSCPPDVTASCPEDVPAPNPGSVGWTDNCGTATVTHVSDESLVDFMSNGIYCTSYLSRLYRVTDACGNFVQCEQIIQIQDICNPGYECPTCEEIVPHFDVDFTDNPDSSWLSPPVVREGTCCAQIGPPPPRCIHFTLTLPPSVVAISFNIESGAVPSGSLFYQIDCNEVHQVGDTICLLGNATYELTFCKPGNNENMYSITAFSGNIIPDTVHTQVNCAADISVEGIVENTAVWNDITGGGLYNSYLSCLSGCLTTTFTPDDNAPPFIMYEVCGDRGSLICGLSVIICDTIIAIVHPEIIASINPNPAVFCADNIGALTGSVSPPGTYSMQWFNGPNGTGSVVGSGPNYTPSASGTYSFVVSDLVNDYDCGEDTANVLVTIIPLPQFELGPDTSVCLEASVFFDLPNGPVYTWLPSGGVTQGNDPSQFTISASSTTSYTVTAVTAEGCEWTDTWSINVVSCMVDCPEQSHCSSGDIVIYQTVDEFINAGGAVSLPCNIQSGSISLVSTNSDGLSCPEMITHTYEIEDDCGNTEMCDVMILIDDTIPPVWTSSPSPVGPLSCSEIIPVQENLTASDNCSVIINTSIDPYVADYCNGYSITMRWTLTDSCGNTAPDQTLVVDILPQEPPVFIDTPGDTSITCEEVIAIVIPDLAYDNGQTGSCQIIGTVPGVMNGPVNECGGQFTIDWSFTDTCGRTITHIQTVTVSDDEDPVITCPMDVNVECVADVPPVITSYADYIAAGGTAMDNCGLLISSFTMTETDNGTCPRTITRTYSIADSCGNTAQCIQTITIDDNSNPVITCPGNLMLECSGDIPPAFSSYGDFINGGGSASDNCGLVETSFTVTESESGTCPLTITRTYSIADSCGNTGQCVQTITVDDQENPSMTCPGDLMVECSGDVTLALTTYAEFINGGGNASDNCSLNEASFSYTETDNGTCPRTITRTYTIADSCGNTGQCVQTITVDDQENPSISCPGDLSLECSGDVPPAFTTYTGFINGGGSASDNCELVEASFTITETNSGTCPKVITRTYSIADMCGNTGQCVQTIIVDDIIPPVITCPGNVNGECSGNVVPAFATLAEFIAGGGAASDNCVLNASSFTVTETDSGICPRTIIRTYEIADSCGNTGQCVQTIIIDDTTPPVITCPGDINEECSGIISPAFTTLAEFLAGGGSALDNCDLDEASFVLTETSNGICPLTIVRTYQIADQCGNTAQCVQTITIDDMTPPVMTCPADANNECSGNVSPAFTTLSEFIAGGGTATDNCALDESSFAVTETDNGACPRTIIRMYTISDSCGNTGQCVQTITIDDPQPPVVTCPADLNFECVGEVPLALVTYNDFINNGGSVSDNCIINESTFAVTESASGICPRIITRAYSIADSCGNTGQCVQTITVDDSQPPVVTCPADLNFECIGDVAPAPSTFFDFINSGGGASDNCGIDPSTFSVNESVSGTCPKIIIRTYSIADSCGNTGQCIQTITVDDPEPPSLTCPAELNFECVGDVPPAPANYADFINNGGSATDNCGINESTFTINESVSGTCPKIIVRTYSIADSCGNTTQCVQTITVDDPTPPVISCPADISDECSGNIPPASVTLNDFLAGGGNASDNCALDESTFSMIESDNGTCPRTITRTYSIADSCGNIGQCVQTIVVDDQVNPVITCPADLMFECAGVIPALLTSYIDFINGGGSASDNCALDINSFTATETDNGTCPRTITRTYTIADSCGNIGQCVQTISVDDQTDPVITCPGDLSLECIGDIPPLVITFQDFLNEGGNASDNCSLDESSFTATETDNGTCPRTITRTYTIADSCGNQAQCVQSISVDDQTDPVMTCPGDLEFECTGDIPPLANSLIEFINSGGSVSDNCGLDESSFTVTEEDNGTCPRMITRTYTIADSCGNIAQCVQIITVDDQINPVMTCPGDETLECAGDIPPAFTTYADFINGGGSASDNCDLDENTFSVTESDNGICPRTIIRTYQIADSCGNTGECVQTITIDDDISPTASNPAPVTIECTGEVPPPDPSLVSDAADNCSIPVVAFVSDESDGGTCPEVITRTYSVTDECENQILVTQIITIGDNIPPTASNPAPIMIECSGEPPAPDPSLITDAADNCSVPVVAFVSDASDGGTCPEVITRTYSVTDECDNQILLTQVITIGDEIPPTSSNPDPISLECSGEVPAPDPSLVIASDNCSVPVVEFVSDESDGSICPETITRTYSVTDECDNQILVTQTITIGDEIPPTASDPAPIVVAGCNQPVPGPDVSLVTDATDNCSTPVVEFLGDAVSVEGCIETTIRTYSITDACENSTTVNQTITRTVDFIPPVFTSVPDDLILECETEIPPIPELDYTDNCSPGGTVTGTVTGPVGDPPVVTWTWEATDDCGNTTTVSVTITMTETTTVTNLTDNFCTGDIYVLPDGSTTTVGGTYGPYTFTGSTGCDSIVNLDLTGIDPVIITITDAICEGDEYILPDGTSTNTEGSYGPFNFVTAEGCDSTVFVELTLIPAIITNLNDEFCEGTTYVLPDGSSTTVGGSFGPFEFVSQGGCDSIVNLELVEIAQIIIDLTDEFCAGDIYTLPDGSTTSEGGVYGPYVYTSANGCDSIVNLDLSEIATPEVEIDEVGQVCISAGIITLIATPTGGTWSGDVNSDQFDPSLAGVGTHEIIYTITAGGCENADTIQITVYELLVSCEALTEESFPGANDGTAGVTVSGGVPPYLLTWTGPVSGSATLDMDGTFIINSLTAGVYTIVVEDAEGCTATCEFTIIANVPCVLTIDEIIPEGATCAGINDGTITVYAEGNTPPLEYSLDGINYQSSNVFEMLAPGTYTVYVKDNADCFQSEVVIIDVGEGPELSIVEIVHASCGANNGSVEVAVAGGTSPYLYSINGVEYGLSSLFPGLLAGDYLIYLFDDAGCTDTIPATIESSTAPAIVNIDAVDASCGLADGSITIQASGGLGVLMYSINGGFNFQVSPVFSGLGSGTYYVIVKDEADCQVAGTATINETGGPVINSIGFTPTGCGLSDGTITVTATGAPVLQYSINGIQFQPSGFFEGLAAGNYTVSVIDGNGCIVIGQVTLNTTDGPLIQNIQHTNTNCGLDDGSIQITASGGTGELEYFLNGESYGDQNIMLDLPAGIYTVEVVDENGCSAGGEKKIDPSEGPDFDVYITPAHCGMADGIIELDGTEGTPPFTYSFNGGPFTGNFTFVNRPSEYYLVAIKDANGCIYEEEVFLWEVNGPEITDVVVIDPDCGLSNGQIEVTATGNTLQYSILTPPMFQSTPVFDSLSPGSYTVIIKDKFNCRDQSIAIIPEKPLPVIDLIPSDSECGMSTGSIMANATGGTPPYLFKLDQGAYGASNFFDGLPAGNYTVTVQGANGCESTENVTIDTDGVQQGSLSGSICEGGIYSLHGNEYSTPGNYSITLQGGASNGCDSVITLSLDVMPLEHKTINEILCPGEVYTVNGIDYMLTGQYIVDTIPGTSGCDTILMLDLLVEDYETKYIDADICQGEVYAINGVEYEMPGEYLIDTISASSGCDSIRILRLEVNPLPQADAGADHLLDCDVQMVVLDGTAIGAEPFWTGPGIHSGNQNQLKPEVTQPGVYTLTLTTSDKCTDEDVVLVNVDPSTVIADAGPDAFLSCDIDSVMLIAWPAGPDLVYQWAGPGIHPQNEQLINPVITVPGVYTVVVTNTSTQCVSLPDTVIITDITNEIVAIVQDPNSLDCFSTFIDLNATGSSTGINLVYVWFNSEGEIIGNTPNLEVSSGGLFTFLVKDTISGCFDRDSVSVTDLIAYPPVDAGDPQQLDCYYETVVLNEGAQNNLFNLVFQWTGPPGGVIGPDTLLSVLAGASGMYYLVAEDTVTGCKNIDSVMVTDVSTLPVADIQVVENITCIDSMALLNTGLSTSGPEISYTWSGPGINGITSTFIEPVTAGQFMLTVFNTINGCSSIDTVLLDLPPQLLELEALIDIPVCEGDASGIITVTGVTGGMPEYLYSIDGQSSQSSPVFENLTAGVYSVSVIDANGCMFSESVTMPDGILLTIDIGIDIELVLGDSIALSADISLPWSQVDSLVWTPAEVLSCDHCTDPVLYGLHDNIITATVYSGGCFAEDIISLRVDDDVEIYIPNVFSPNGDGVNEHVTVFTDPRVKRVVSLEIFDRWGNNVFAGRDFPPNDPLLGWDGTFRNQPMNPAVFAFVAHVELINGDVVMRMGDITLTK